MEALLLGGVHGSCDHHTQSGQELDNCSENKSLALLEPEELQDEDKEADAAEDGGQDHGGLDGLQKGCVFGVAVLYGEARVVAGIPQVGVDGVMSSRSDHPPRVIYGGHKEQGSSSHMEEDDENQDDQHGGLKNIKYTKSSVVKFGHRRKRSKAVKIETLAYLKIK